MSAVDNAAGDKPAGMFLLTVMVSISHLRGSYKEFSKLYKTSIPENGNFAKGPMPLSETYPFMDKP